jgi:hypothetical protein
MASLRPTPAATEALGKLGNAGFLRVAPPKPGRIDTADTSALGACHLDIVPLSQIADRDLIAVALENDNVILLAHLARADLHGPAR